MFYFANTHTHTYTHAHTHTHTHTLTHTHTQTQTHAHTNTLSHSLTYSTYLPLKMTHLTFYCYFYILNYYLNKSIESALLYFVINSWFEHLNFSISKYLFLFCIRQLKPYMTIIKSPEWTSDWIVKWSWGRFIRRFTSTFCGRRFQKTKKYSQAISVFLLFWDLSL